MHTQSLVRGELELICRPTASYCVCRQTKPRDVVYLVDADLLVREAISDLSGLMELGVIHFRSLQEFLVHSRDEESSCLILNLCSRDQENFDLQCRLAAEASPPMIFICSNGDVAAAVQAIKSGAVGVLTAPIGSIDLAEAVHEAIARDRQQRRHRAEREELRQRHALLTPREQEVLPLVVEGLMNKQAAAVLGISETTLQIHRSQVMRKMRADSVPKLVRMAATLEISPRQDCDPDKKDFPNLQFLSALRRRSA